MSAVGFSARARQVSHVKGSLSRACPQEPALYVYIYIYTYTCICISTVILEYMIEYDLRMNHRVFLIYSICYLIQDGCMLLPISEYV